MFEKIKKFFAKIKVMLGIGTVKLVLDVPEYFKKDDDKIEGELTITGKSEQKINAINFQVKENYSKKGKDGQQKTKHFVLGTAQIAKEFLIKEGEEKKVKFSIPFELKKSQNDKMKDAGGVIGALGSVGSFLDNEKSTYFVSAEVDIDAAKLDPTVTRVIKKAKD